MQEIRLSPSSIQAFKMCPLKFLYGNFYGLQPDKEKDSYRIGTIWHRCLEILGMLSQGRCPDCFRHEELDPACSLCEGSGVLPIDLMDAVVRYLNQVYEIVPENKTHDQWEVERIQILYSLSGYRWMFPDMHQRYKTMASEVWFELPIFYSNSRRKVPKSCTCGKIDEIIRAVNTGLLYIGEHKSTSTSFEGKKGSAYWDRLKKDVQVTEYLWAARKMQLAGELEKFGIRRDEPLIQGIWYDVWHKPTIAPKMLSQKDSKEFVETGEYFGEKFEIYTEDENPNIFYIGAFPLITTPGKKEGTFTIFETPEMYGARLLSDIATRPEFYFQQREIPRTDQQLEDFEKRLPKICGLIRTTEINDWWDENDMACESPYHCDFKDICYQNLNVGPDDCPDGYKKRKKKLEENNE